ncbi:MAG: hypothetical protein EOP84_22675 [Verrucomicrobiaceae bacterium]|nr:MAG: hypothetical protein EOP84_22675 [Verrucomicrobiaceae bacterium]
MKILACVSVSLMVCGSVFAGEATASTEPKTTAEADSSPSMYEAGSFVKNKLKQGGLTNVRFDNTGKELKFTVPGTNQSGRIFLNLCDPERVEVSSTSDGKSDGRPSVTIFGSNDEDIFSSIGSEGRNRYQFVVASKEDAERVGKAFRHLIKLCGGKKSAF